MAWSNGTCRTSRSSSTTARQPTRRAGVSRYQLPVQSGASRNSHLYFELTTGNWKLPSLSPRLFFRRRGSDVITLFTLALLALVGMSIAAVLGLVFFLLKMVFWVVFFPVRLILKLLWIPVGLTLGAIGLAVGAVALPLLLLIGAVVAVVVLVLPLLPFILLALLLWAIFARRPALA